MQEYEQLYADFMRSYQSGTTTGEDVGILITRLAGYYPTFNMAMAKAERKFAIVSESCVMQTDESTGKGISATKAQTIADASEEAAAFREARVHVQNLEMLIQSAKALQRGLLQEAVHSNV